MVRLFLKHSFIIDVSDVKNRFVYQIWTRHLLIKMFVVVVFQVLTFHQELSYGDETSSLSLIWKTGGAEDWLSNPWIAKLAG